jgi:hypothetical protein
MTQYLVAIRLSLAKMPSGWNGFEISDIQGIQLSHPKPAIRM